MSIDKPKIVLVRTSLPVNIGTTARAMANMGVDEMCLVSPKCSHLETEAIRASAGADEILRSAKIFDEIPSAISDCTYVLGATARQGERRGLSLSPKDAAKKIKGKTSILFGPEDTGLLNSDLIYCMDTVTIPTSETFNSLNLAQAVLIVLYEWRIANLEGIEKSGKVPVPVSELEPMLEDCFEILDKVGFLNPQNPEHIKLDIRRTFTRSEMDSREVTIWRGIWHKIYCALGNKK